MSNELIRQVVAASVDQLALSERGRSVASLFHDMLNGPGLSLDSMNIRAVRELVDAWQSGYGVTVRDEIADKLDLP